MAPEAWHVARTMRILELLAFAQLSVAQISEALDAHPRTVRRVLGRLVEEEYVIYDRGRRVYGLTTRLVALAAQLVEHSDLVRRARPYVALLQARADVAAHLVVPSYRSVVCLVHETGAADDRPPHARETIPAHATAGGKALLAWREAWRDSLLAAPLERFTAATVVDPAAVRRGLEDVRSRGYAEEAGEYRSGVDGVAAPVLVQDEAIAALTIAGDALDPASADYVTTIAADLAADLARGR